MGSTIFSKEMEEL